MNERRPLLLLTRPIDDSRSLARRARSRGFATLASPLLAIVPLPAPEPWTEAQALLLTSARSAALARAAWGAWALRLPAFAVGPATARAARRAGFTLAGVGRSDATQALGLAAQAGVRRLLHAGSVDRAPVQGPPELQLVHRALYEARPRPLSARARRALAEGRVAAVVLMSPRTARLFRAEVERAGLDLVRLRLVAISEATAAAAGAGWRDVAVAARPDAAAVLESAWTLWQGVDRHG